MDFLFSTFLLFLMFSPLIMVGFAVWQTTTGNFFRWPLMLIKRKPKYMIIKHRGHYFPIKRRRITYNYMLRNETFGDGYWEEKTSPQKVSLNHDNLWGYPSLDKAIEEIEDIDGVDIKEVDPNGFSGCAWRGNPTFFDVATKAVTEDSEQKETIDHMIDAKYSEREILNTEVGAERDLMRN